MESTERRTEARLRLAYPIRLRAGEDAYDDDRAATRVDRATLGHGSSGTGSGRSVGGTVTRDLSARGAYFSTFDAPVWAVGQRVGVVISVPHRLDGAAADVILDLRAEASVVRVDRPGRTRLYGEDGLALTGVALQFAEPLRFRYAWV